MIASGRSADGLALVSCNCGVSDLLARSSRAGRGSTARIRQRHHPVTLRWWLSVCAAALALGSAQPGKAPYAEERFLKEAQRLYGVLDRRLAEREFVADSYSIADIAIWPWVSRYEWQTIDLKGYPNVRRWYTTIAKRPAVQKGYKVPKDVGEIPIPA